MEWELRQEMRAKGADNSSLVLERSVVGLVGAQRCSGWLCVLYIVGVCLLNQTMQTGVDLAPFSAVLSLFALVVGVFCDGCGGGSVWACCCDDLAVLSTVCESVIVFARVFSGIKNHLKLRVCLYSIAMKLSHLRTSGWKELHGQCLK